MLIAIGLLALVVAAYLEITGDVAIGDALNPIRWRGIAWGWILLGLYGVAVNGYNWLVVQFRPGANEEWRFSRLLGAYIAIFALVNLLLALRREGSSIQDHTIIGTCVIIIGGVIIQFGPGIVRLARMLSP
jgi:drug/metabolite transporter superfamily protein YnfA